MVFGRQDGSRVDIFFGGEGFLDIAYTCGEGFGTFLACK